MAAVKHVLADLTAKSITGELVNCNDFIGKVLLIVNVASACGYTDKTYKDIQALYLKHQERGLVVIGFPCNQFKSQETGTCSEILRFAVDKYAVTFPMMDKVATLQLKSCTHVADFFLFIETAGRREWPRRPSCFQSPQGSSIGLAGKRECQDRIRRRRLVVEFLQGTPHAFAALTAFCGW